MWPILAMVSMPQAVRCTVTAVSLQTQWVPQPPPTSKGRSPQLGHASGALASFISAARTQLRAATLEMAKHVPQQ